MFFQTSDIVRCSRQNKHAVPVQRRLPGPKPRTAGLMSLMSHSCQRLRGSVFLKSAGTSNRSALTPAVEIDTNSEFMVSSGIRPSGKAGRGARGAGAGVGGGGPRVTLLSVHNR